MLPDAAVELLTDPLEPLTEPEETEPEGVVELTPPDADGELTLPVAGELTVFPDGELVLTPVPLVAPVLGAPGTVLLPLTDPAAPGLAVVGDADGLLLLATPATCIAS